MTEFNEELSLKQVSDDLPHEIVVECFHSCERDDCHISAKYLGGTMMGYSKYYTKDGRFIVDDHNSCDYKIGCMTCGTIFKLRTKGSTIITMQKLCDNWGQKSDV